MDEISLETALATTQKDAEAALKAANGVTSALKKLQKAAQDGRLQELRKALEGIDQVVTALRQQVVNTREGWQFDEEPYLADGAYAAELLAEANRAGVGVFPADDLLYCYPSLIRIIAGDRAVRIDKTMERRLRPSVLVAHLREVQKKGARFKEEAFLESLYSAYELCVARVGREFIGGRVERLTDVYSVLTMLPGATREYSLQEFTRDVYLLDQSGVRETKRGKLVTFPAATGTRGKPLSIVTQDGQQKLYYGIAFEE